MPTSQNNPQQTPPPAPPRNLGGFWRNLGGRARANTSFSGRSTSLQNSQPPTPAAKYETASDKLSSLLASRPVPAALQSSKLHSINGNSTASVVAEVLATSTDAQEQAILLKRLVHSLRVDSQSDPSDVWERCAFLLEPQHIREVRGATLDLLRVCVNISNEDISDSCYSYERRIYYIALKHYYESKDDLGQADMHALVTVLEGLTRGGRDVLGLEGIIPFLTDISMSIFRLRQTERICYIENLEVASTPLLDQNFQTPMVRLPPDHFLLSSDPKTSPAALIIACHKFSFAQILPTEVHSTLSTMIRRGLYSLGEHEIVKSLELVDTIVKFGYVPGDLLEDVVKFVARAAGIEGKCQVIDISPDGERRLSELPGDLSALAQSVMRNLLRSPSNQALKHLRGVLSLSSTPSGPTSQCQTPLLVGCLKCLRRAFKDFEETAPARLETPDRGEQYPTLLEMGMTVVHQNLLDVLEWKSSKIDCEVLLFLEERCAAKTTANMSISYEEWEMVISILERLTWHIGAWETHTNKSWSIEVAAQSVNRKLPVASSKSDAAPAALTTSPISSPQKTNQPSIDVHVLTSFSLVVQRILVAQSGDDFKGSHLQFFDFLLSIARHLSGSAIISFFNFYQSRVLASPGRGDWLLRLRNIVDVFFPRTPYKFVRESVKAGRRSAVQLLRDAYAASQGYPQYMLPFVQQILIPWFEHALPIEEDTQVATSAFAMMERCAKDYFALGQDASKVYDEPVRQVLDILNDLSWKRQQSPQSSDSLRNSATPSASSTSAVTNSILFSPSRSPERSSPRPNHSFAPPDLSSMAAQTMIAIFYHSIIHAKVFSAELALYIFNHMLTLVSPVPPPSKRAKAPTRTRLMILQCLVRLRADQKHRVFARQGLDFEALAASIGRLDNSESPEKSTEQYTSTESSQKPQEKERGRRNHRRDHVAKESEQSASPQSGHGRSKTGSRSRTRGGSPTPVPRGPQPSNIQLWSYPDVLLYTFPPHRVISVGDTGLVSFDHIRMRDWSESLAESDSEYSALASSAHEPPLTVLPVSGYLEVLVRCLTEETDWELVSYILCAVPNQLSNKHFACGPRAAKQLQILRKVLCDHLLKDTLGQQVQLPTSVKRSDMHSVAYQWLATLIAYRDLYTKEKQNEMVVTFMRGLSKTPNIAKPSIHALTMACYEFESAMSKYLPEILGALVRIMSTVNMPVHILELVASIGHIRSLYANFTEDDYKKVFALAVQYLSTHYENLLDDPDGGIVPDDLKKALAHAFKQYVFLLSYYVIALWYTIVPLHERPKYTGFVVQRLLRANEGHPSIDAATEVSLDMLARLAYSPSTPFTIEAPRNWLTSNDDSYFRGWVIANSVISIEGKVGEKIAELCIRRPSGVSKQYIDHTGDHTQVDILQVLHNNRSKFQIEPAQQSNPTVTTTGGQPLFDADPTFFSLFLPPQARMNDHGLPQSILPNDQTRRALSVLDSMPHVDFHKIGVLYIGSGQTTENQILQNVHGSRSYMSFLSGLGDLVRLKGCGTYTGGLDRENDFDGKWTYIWSDEIQQIIFHITTLMPTRLDTDPGCNYKKRHIGNDYVKVFFNDSGIRTPFDIIPGQFNFVNIIIEPHTPAGEAWKGAAGISNNTEFFRVSMQQRSDMPEIGPLGIFKMVSTTSLASVVRELALHANLFAQLFLQSVGVEGRTAARQKVEYTTTWRNRLQAIKRLKEIVQADTANAKTKAEEEDIHTVDHI